MTTPTAAAKAAIARINAVDHLLDAFITVTPARALAEARIVEARLAEGEAPGLLSGVPYALKDIYDTAGIRTTCHSRLREEHMPAADCQVAERLRLAGALLVGKTGTHEFAIGRPSFDLPFPPPRNPWNREHVPGGSSSGSAAAVAAGMVRFALGSDTGGSIRHPAACCGVVGLKPSYGRVSRRGVQPLAWSMDHCGPLAATVRDAALALQVIAGHDPLDPASADVPVGDYLSHLEHGVAGLRIGIPRAWFTGVPGADAEALAAIDHTASVLREAGARVEDVVLPDYALFAAAGRVILHAEAFALHAKDLRNRPQEYGRDTFQSLVLGANLTATDLLQAQRMRRTLTDAVDTVLARHDALLTANLLTTAPRFDTPRDPIAARALAQMIQFNLTGHPALALPVALHSSGLPLGVQFAGRWFDEATLLRIGRTVEKCGGWEQCHRPPLYRG
ncbi:MAG TPA: amidase [Acetobacteraceae bacterium]|nr:amidase [Acetobacteraceae bacterium]